MHHFTYKDGRLHCEDVDLNRIADEVGTPCYVYSSATLVRHAGVIASAFEGQDCLIAFSVKSNGNIGVLSTLAREGCGADVVSGGELQRALKAGIPAGKIVFSGVGKTAEEMRLAMQAGIHQFNVESAGELRRLSEVATMNNLEAPIAIRVNPDVAAGGHPNISTGKKGDKFGVPWSDAEALYTEAANLPGIRVVGVDVHIGSQIGDLVPMRAAFEKVIGLTRRLREAGHDIQRIDLGGGLGIPYKASDDPAPPSAYAAMIAEVTEGMGLQVILEPGRVISGNAGVMLSTVLYEKQAPDTNFLIIDAGMNDLIRPALYDAHHDIMPLEESGAGVDRKTYDVVGPICESTDKFAKNRELPALRPGQRIAFMSAGAYGAVLSSTYNARPLVPEVLVNGASFDIIRRRPDFEEMIALEKVPDWLTPTA
ncbi:diaminopimelate decarboxylase [Hyphomonas pacifica]|uniref:Diaminopimelate decarboxylase n=1 Tax=Hyphomonas pacifica TaxID=1280941 RepID=A0A062TXS7_9PROT|nr:diaminopimelate decarboxylase [Hyphomonas pacifica]KCZ50298.1 diaminopimelate decarboxylase [Hyphomonas pacifica]RAN32783.1 diaminopimelate decarboxylase [Hyphomonas pacifica]